MPMYNLNEYSKKYSKTSGILWNYYRDQANNGAEGDIKQYITGKLEGIGGRNFCTIKIFKQLLENTGYTINKL